MWLSANKLKFAYFQINENSLFLVQIENFTNFSKSNTLGNFLSPAEVVRNLGVWFDTDWSFLRHIQHTYKSFFAQVLDLECFRGCLTHDATLMAANALVGT